MVTDPIRHAAARWWGAALGFALLASPVMVWGLFAEPPLVAGVAALVAVALGVVCFTVGTVLKARAERVSAVRLIGRALWAPIKFLLEYTF